ncbi:hypothetical protein [Agrobacterium vitis]|uniref:hypothetical protein n=1 Tax=Agrobacterium vitis TaxID=373 RepID=UPI001F33F180|nr:hypothetical protein [Agrobacterium vitis]
MPHKHNEDRRHKIPKQKFKVTNWAAYNESLRQRGDLTVWISVDAQSQWSRRAGHLEAASRNIQIWRLRCA